MRPSILRLLAIALFVVLVAAWTKEGSSCLAPVFYYFVTIVLLFSCSLYQLQADRIGALDHEIFRIRDEIVASEGANVTFYGTAPIVLAIPLQSIDLPQYRFIGDQAHCDSG